MVEMSTMGLAWPLKQLPEGRNGGSLSPTLPLKARAPWPSFTRRGKVMRKKGPPDGPPDDLK
jgi:hypothetical protein